RQARRRGSRGRASGRGRARSGQIEAEPLSIPPPQHRDVLPVVGRANQLPVGTEGVGRDPDGGVGVVDDDEARLYSDRSGGERILKHRDGASADTFGRVAFVIRHDESPLREERRCYLRLAVVGSVVDTNGNRPTVLADGSGNDLVRPVVRGYPEDR